MDYKNYMRPEGKGIKLHLGCGDYWFEGYINIDIHVYGGTDLILDIRQKLPFQDHVVSDIQAYEVVEHFYQSEIDIMLEDWKRLLIKGGKVRISVPNMDELVKLYAEDSNTAIQQMYGFEQCQNHKWGYTKETLTKLFEKHGFLDIGVVEGSLPERPNEKKLILEATI